MHHKSRSHSVWFLRYRQQKTKFFVIMDHFLPFDSPNNQENENFEKIKKNPGDIIILKLCTTNDDHIMYGLWDIKRTKQIFLSFWAIFCPFTPLTTQKIKLKKMKKNFRRYHHFKLGYHKLWLDDVRFLRYGAQQMDGWTDERKKWHIEVDAPPKNW